MYGWLTNTGVKLVIIVDMEGRPATNLDSKSATAVGLRDADMKPLPTRFALTLRNIALRLYDRLIDYEPTVEYSERLQQLSRAVNGNGSASSLSENPHVNRFGRQGVWTSLLAQKERRDSLALTRVLTDHEQAMQLQSPKGFMLHGEVGTGKSMLIDLFQDCLPNRKKRRWHFNTFMLDTISRLEKLRRSRSLVAGPGAVHDEYSLLLVARDLIEKSPILFLDEFQLPDRAASKILSNLMTSFFQLGGVLIATSNRMPEELAKAAGMDFARPVNKLSGLGWSLGKNPTDRRNDGAGQLGEFSAFLEVLRARCEVWEMEGKSDYRKMEREEATSIAGVQTSSLDNISSSSAAAGMGNTGFSTTQQNTSVDSDASEAARTSSTVAVPKNYLVQPTKAEAMVDFAESFNTLVERATQHAYPIPWESATLSVYGRTINVPAQYNHVAFFTFEELCGATLGPADYITLASTYHTFILTDVPVMGFLNKNEARRLITLLDAMYEARCRLLVVAVTGPDNLFFPEPDKISSNVNASSTTDALTADAVHSETFSEIYQDLNSPFRPNISSYTSGSTLSDDALEDDPPNRTRREGSSYTDERSGKMGSKAPDFANIRGLTGEDEVFAVRRAESRIWEMCSGRWWDRAGDASVVGTGAVTEDMTRAGSESVDWWRPLPMELRHWEFNNNTPADTNQAPLFASPATAEGLPPNVKILSREELDKDKQKELEDMYAHGASPFRTHPDAPPKFSWTHAWGMMTWGKKAGAWGKGPDGLGERGKVGKSREENEMKTEGNGEKK
ncbi:mitochondrial ATPase [Plenodomus tracheiphilus IPT5]|uniref:Mitochondrial ATPase n=1 Tax=Plenodomus tracheiphilus IPT5 TaxID=1408161 RepID=A0A6A7AY15_9PLEO|nr:mitochondrial ATPase [Plenodomus tracheiphilus IPT5]